MDKKFLVEKVLEDGVQAMLSEKDIDGYELLSITNIPSPINQNYFMLVFQRKQEERVC